MEGKKKEKYIEEEEGFAKQVFPAVDDIDSQGYPPRRMVYHSPVSTHVTSSSFLAGNGETELRHTTFSLILLFLVFVFHLLHPPSPPAI